MTTETNEKKESKNTEIIFICKYCQMSKPLNEMVVIDRFFPPVVACRDCDKKMR